MTKREHHRFLRDMASDEQIRKYYDFIGACAPLLSRAFHDASVGSVDLQRSTCSRAADRDDIHRSISETIGFAKLQRMVFGVLENWMELELRHHIGVVASAMDSDGNDMLWCHFSSVLAIVLSQQGRLSDAAVTQEEILQYIKQKLSRSGSADSVWLEMMRVVMQNLAGHYGKMGRLSDAIVLQEEVARISESSKQERYKSE